MNDIEDRARALFERSVEGLDEAAVKRLRLARRSTLASDADPAPRWQAWPAGLAAAGVLALGLAWWLPRTSMPPPPAPVAANAVPAPADADEPVLAEADEDSELYAFLAEAPVAADPAKGHNL